MLALGVSFALMGCPPAEKTTDGGTTGDTPAADGAAPAADGAPATDGETPATNETDGAAPADTPAPAEKKEVDLSHVKAGQKYHYHMNNAGMEMDQVWEVVEVTDSEVKYKLTTIMNGNPVGDPTDLSWAIPAAPADAPVGEPDPNAKPPVKEKVTVAGQEWDSLVVEAAGFKTWVPQKNDLPTFPPLLKQMKGDQVTNELTKIE